MTIGGDVIDEALERFGTTGPEFGGGLSNHGPMAADALIALGRPDAVVGWSEWYAQRLTEHPQPRNPIAAAEWQEALGDIKRAGDWIAFFDAELRERPWTEVLETWVARLAPGIMAGATHGVLRTAHGVRSLDRGESAVRLHELAEGLGYWAARYQALPGELAGNGTLPPSSAIASVPRSEEGGGRAGLITTAVRALDPARMAPVLGLVDVTGDTGAFVSDVTRTFVRQYLANADTAAIAFVHSVTAPSALRLLVPHLSDETRRAAMAYAWQACASLYAAFGRAPDVRGEFEAVEFDGDDFADRAVAVRDEHAIKFTDACLREYRLSGDPAFIAAARDILARFGRAR
jgi:hypothetical protein